MEEIITKNEYDHSYLLCRDLSREIKDYDYKMTVQNHIEGFLNCKVRFDEDISYLYYDVTSKKSLQKEYADRQMSFEEFYFLFYQLSIIQKRAASFLLQSSRIIFLPEYLYFDLETEDLYCMYIPFDRMDSTEQNSSLQDRRYIPLAEFLLDKINHRDEHAVNAAYQFYKMAKEEFFSFEAFFSFLEKENELMQKEQQPKIEALEKIENQENNQIVLNDESDIEVLPLKQLLLSSAVVIVGVIVVLTGLFLSFFQKYKLIISTSGIVVIIFAAINTGRFVIMWIKKKRNEQSISFYDDVTVDDYFKNQESSQTVFFDEDVEKRPSFTWQEEDKTREYIAYTFPFTIGKQEEDVDMVMLDTSVSRIHARIMKKGKIFFIQDLGSTNGTAVNGKKIKGRQQVRVRPGDEIQIAKVLVSMV